MANDQGKDGKGGFPGADYFTEFANLANQGQALMSQWMAGFAAAGDGAAGLKEKFATSAKSAEEMAGAFANVEYDTKALLDAQLELWNSYQQLWMSATQRMLHGTATPTLEPEAGDRRFRHPEWTENPIFDFLKQSYLINARWMRNVLGAMNGLERDTEQKMHFYARQMIDAWSPSNFPLTNPEVLKETRESGGENLMRGAQNFMADLQSGGGVPSIKQTDTDAFTVGENLALTPGEVVYQNELMQLIQYAPQTEQVYKRPLLIIPPWINKFYILDLQPENSFVRWLSGQGYTVFLISWVNPDESLRDKGFEDYMTDGIFAALDAIEQATGVREVSTIGYCIGGTLLAATLAYMAANGDDRIKAATFLAAQVDFAEAGELRVFTDASQLDQLEAEVEKRGVLDGALMAWTFNMLRANDLIWSYVVSNYLLGRQPAAFDLLYWNADSTRLPARMLMYYLRNMYQKNLLAKPGGLELLGTPIDLTKIKTPAFFQATREDHIAPYGSVYKAMGLFAGEKRFALAGSGHIAGIVNPPSKQKYQFWSNAKRKDYADAESWLAEAEEKPGSWWPYWHRWNARKSGAKVKARRPGGGKLTPIEPAPGSYVKVRN